jgi:hypothetical protein
MKCLAEKHAIKIVMFSVLCVCVCARERVSSFPKKLCLNMCK